MHLNKFMVSKMSKIDNHLKDTMLSFFSKHIMRHRKLYLFLGLVYFQAIHLAPLPLFPN